MGFRIKRFLLSAYACDPTRGGEWGVGWHALLTTLKVSDRVWLATHSPNVSNIRNGLTPEQLTRLEILSIEGPRWVQSLSGRIPLGGQAYYFGWQFRAALRIRSLKRSVSFDMGQHASFGPDWAPCALAYVPDLTWAWGPVGGASHTPVRLWKWLGVRGTAFEVGRRLAVMTGHKIFGNRAARRASVIFAQNEDVVKQFAHRASVSLQPSPAIELGSVSEAAAPLGAQRSFLCIGRLLPWKGWALAIAALAHTSPSTSLQFFGVGQDLRRLRMLAKRYGVEERVTFNGLVPRGELLEGMANCTGIVFPSFHDSAPWTVAEALSLGVPVIGLDVEGVHTLLRLSGGVSVDHRSRNLPAEIAKAMAAARPHAPSTVWTVERFQTRFGSILLEVAQEASSSRAMHQ